VTVVVTREACVKLDDVEAIARGEQVNVAGDVLDHLGYVRRSYEEEASRRRVYGYCTGLGALQGLERTCDGEGEAVVLREHAVGAGPVAPREWVRAFMGVRLVQLARGYAPVRGEVVEYIAEALNSGLTPLVPVVGSVGASGDLSPSAYVFRCILLGEGYAISREGGVTRCSSELVSLNMKPPKLAVGEALALINNTAWSTALAALASLALERLLRKSLEVASRVLEVTGCNREHYSVEAVAAKRHPRSVEVARVLVGVKPRVDRSEQEPYSFRCIPQVYGAALEAVGYAMSLIEREVCSASENPLVVDGKVYHACNFHTIYVALASELLSWATASLINMTYQRIHHLMKSTRNTLSDFLASPKSSVGAMLLEYLAASLVAEARSEAIPRTLEWVPTSLGQEDSNPMTTNSILRVMKLLDALAWAISAEATLASLIYRSLGLEDPWGVEASLDDLDSSLVRARRRVVEPVLYTPIKPLDLGGRPEDLG